MQVGEEKKKEMRVLLGLRVGLYRKVLMSMSYWVWANEFRKMGLGIGLG